MLRAHKTHYLFWLLAASISLNSACSSCGKTGPAPGVNSPPPASPAVSALPFSTREPALYQAEIVISITETDAGGQKYFIARDGEKRRTDYELSAKETMSVLEDEGGKTIVLLPQKKCSAEEKKAAGSAAPAQGESFTDFLTSGWLAEKIPTNFESLGKETVGGRALAKFRVRYEKTNGVESPGEALVWVDEELGMPVRTEFYTLKDGQKMNPITTEFRNIKLSVDAGVFNKPDGCQNISAGEMQNILWRERLEAE